MVSILFEGKSLFDKLNLIHMADQSEICQIYSTEEFGLPVKYSITNGHPYMTAIIANQLIGDDSTILIYLSVISDSIEGFPEVANVVEATNSDELNLPATPIFIKFNHELVVPVEMKIRFNSVDASFLYTCAAFDIPVLFLKIREDYIDKFSLIFIKKLPEILLADLEKNLADSNPTGYAIMKSFDRITDSLMYFAKLQNRESEIRRKGNQFDD